jgi:tetratricopeptide (TPR) repeat protein
MVKAPTGGGQRATDYGQLDLLWSQAMRAHAADAPAEARRWLSQVLVDPANGGNIEAVWFELGTVALEEARANSRRLSEVAPDSVWNRRLEAQALAVRYPDLAGRSASRESEVGRQKTESRRQNEPETGRRELEIGGRERQNFPALALVDAPLRHLEKLAESPEVLYQRARAALELSKTAYLQASRSPRFDARLCALRALAAEEEHDEAAAIREYRAGLIRHPDSAILHAGLGHLYRRRQDFQPAARELAEAWRLNRADPVVAFELGDTFRHAGQPQRALQLLNQALELEPGLLLARWSRGRVYLALGDDQRALADLEAAVAVDNTGELQWQLAGLYRKLGQPERADQAQQRSNAQRAGQSRGQGTGNREQ